MASMKTAATTVASVVAPASRATPITAARVPARPCAKRGGAEAYAGRPLVGQQPVDRVEDVPTREERAPPQRDGQREDRRPGAEEPAREEPRAHDARLEQQRRRDSLLGVRRRQLESLLQD